VPLSGPGVPRCIVSKLSALSGREEVFGEGGGARDGKAGEAPSSRMALCIRSMGCQQTRLR
jgi:hypothetical protein